jgi:hypothetical protein
MSFVTHASWPAQPGYVDLERCILLGPDAALIPSREHPDLGIRPPGASAPWRNEWLLELYEGDDEPVRVLIAGEDE